MIPFVSGLLACRGKLIKTFRHEFPCVIDDLSTGRQWFGKSPLGQADALRLRVHLDLGDAPAALAEALDNAGSAWRHRLGAVGVSTSCDFSAVVSNGVERVRSQGEGPVTGRRHSPKQGPELLEHRLALYGEEQRMVFGATTYRAFAQMLASSTEESDVRDPWVTRMRNLPATVVSTTLEGALDWPDATLANGDAVDVVARLKEDSEIPLRSHGSLSMNRALMAAGLVDRVQVTLFPVITGQTGTDPIFQGAADFDLELIETRTLDDHIQELIYRPTLHA
jgi:dihydrofolate reductase